MPFNEVVHLASIVDGTQGQFPGPPTGECSVNITNFRSGHSWRLVFDSLPGDRRIMVALLERQEKDKTRFSVYTENLIQSRLTVSGSASKSDPYPIYPNPPFALNPTDFSLWALQFGDIVQTGNYWETNSIRRNVDDENEWSVLRAGGGAAAALVRTYLSAYFPLSGEISYGDAVAKFTIPEIAITYTLVDALPDPIPTLDSNTRRTWNYPSNAVIIRLQYLQLDRKRIDSEISRVEEEPLHVVAPSDFRPFWAEFIQESSTEEIVDYSRLLSVNAGPGFNETFESLSDLLALVTTEYRVRASVEQLKSAKLLRDPRGRVFGINGVERTEHRGVVIINGRRQDLAIE